MVYGVLWDGHLKVVGEHGQPATTLTKGGALNANGRDMRRCVGKTDHRRSRTGRSKRTATARAGTSRSAATCYWSLATATAAAATTTARRATRRHDDIEKRRSWRRWRAERRRESWFEVSGTRRRVFIGSQKQELCAAGSIDLCQRTMHDVTAHLPQTALLYLVDASRLNCCILFLANGPVLWSSRVYDRLSERCSSSL